MILCDNCSVELCETLEDAENMPQLEGVTMYVGENSHTVTFCPVCKNLDRCNQAKAYGRN